MSLFERLKNKRSSLQEKKDDTTGRRKNVKVNIQDLQKKISKNPKLKNIGVKTTDTNTVKQSEVSKKAKVFTADVNKKRTKRVFPGDKTGAYKAAKIDIEVKKGLKDAGASGDFSPTMSTAARKKSQAIRDARIKRLATPDPFDDDYAKKTGKVDKRTKVGKKIGSAFETPTKSQIKKLDKKPGGYRAPTGDFGKGITQGQANALRMDKKAFVKTPYAEYDPIKQPRGVKIPGKTYKDFSKQLRIEPRTIKKKYKPTTTVKQAEVSKDAKKFSKGIEQAKKAKTDKVVDLATKKQQSKLNQAATDLTQQRDDAIVKREKLRSMKGVKDTKAIRATNRQVIEFDKLAQTTKKAASGVGNPLAPVKYNKMTAGADFIKKNRVGKKTGSQIFNQNKIKGAKPPTGGTVLPKVSKQTPKVSKQTKALMSGQQIFAKSAVGKGLQKNLPQVYKGLKALKPAGRAFAKTGLIGGAATIGTAFLAKNLLKKAAIGGVGGGILGAAAASQKMSDKERIKKNLPAQFVKDKDGKEIKKVATMGLNLSDISKPKKKLKPRTSTSLQGSADYAGKVKNIPAYGAKYTG